MLSLCWATGSLPSLATGTSGSQVQPSVLSSWLLPSGLYLWAILLLWHRSQDVFRFPSILSHTFKHKNKKTKNKKQKQINSFLNPQSPIYHNLELSSNAAFVLPCVRYCRPTLHMLTLSEHFFLKKTTSPFTMKNPQIPSNSILKFNLGTIWYERVLHWLLYYVHRSFLI